MAEKKADAKKATPDESAKVARIGTGEPVISARRISLWYGQVIGINNISLDLCQGVIGLLGPNGAGKSTLFKCLSGQLQPQTGTIAIHKKSVWNNSGVFSRIGFVPEQDSFYENMSGLEFVTYLTRLQGFAPDDARTLAEEALARVSMSERQHDRIREYSKGMRQRVKIAQALAHKPDVYFLDEPLTGTDPVGRRQIIELIQELGDAGKTVLVSSHILHEVEQMTSDILMINRGRIIADGNVYQIREMIDDHPHTIIIGCDAPRKMAALLTEFEDVVSIAFEESVLKVATHNPDACYTRIPQLALEHDILLRRMSSPDNNLMAVFRYLVG